MLNTKELPVLWDRMPAELRKKKMATKRSAMSTSKINTKPKRLKKTDDPNKILASLEEKEKMLDGDEENGKNKITLLIHREILLITAI